MNIIKPDDLPMSWRNILPWQQQQEKNLHYVALTRAKNRLIIAGKCSWYGTEDTEEEQPESISTPPAALCGAHSEPTDEELTEAVRMAIGLRASAKGNRSFWS
jgi:ATP-dependent exoDNAse (exonuclease V) beta subunit